ncbi:DNA cytosine methyltransferase [Natronomonas halophila]|uniref:DNA cytosine methyltransferase n=1 Tax=Natronomonas halophila TaxID=2747817 RepID=UPI0015B46F58|nr:DNA cytosine methyltransferase [Natronomonas halophila]QLD84592.1 DNA cytosine methyltransferase [Natronomonas halophila]QLD84648.1 DNA cytosine methyltransferase [Natronomonas halophila]
MLKSSAFLGTHQYEEPESLQERIGYSSPPTHVSLFSGIGGFDLGFGQAGFKNLVAVEQNEHAAATYRRNLIEGDHLDQDEPPVLMERDIRKVSTWEILEAAGVGVGEITAISGGPPCQGFSHIGTRDEDDPRNELYLEMARIVHQAKPVSFVMENVPGLATMKDGQAIMEVCETFADAGYNVTWEVVDAADYGVPQHRERVIITGKRVDVMGVPEEGNPQLHLGAKPGRVNHPESFRERHDLKEPDQATLDSFGNEPETLDGLLEQAIQDGIESVGGGSR